MARALSGTAIGLVLAPLAEAARGGGGGGGARASAAARPNVQPNHSRADVGTRDVRSTSVNNVNVNRNVNVSVDQNHRNWDHPVRRQIFSGFRCARDAVPGAC